MSDSVILLGPHQNLPCYNGLNQRVRRSVTGEKVESLTAAKSRAQFPGSISLVWVGRCELSSALIAAAIPIFLQHLDSLFVPHLSGPYGWCSTLVILNAGFDCF